MDSKNNVVVYQALRKILSSVCRLLMRYSISNGEFVELFKSVYVETAQKELGYRRDRPANKSKVAAATGLSRKEVARICDLNEVLLNQNGTLELKHHKSAKLTNTWQNDPLYVDTDGNPIPLPMKANSDDQPSFSKLLKEHFGDLPPATVLNELMRSGVVEQNQKKEVILSGSGYIPKESEMDKVAILGADVKALIDTIENKLGEQGNPPEEPLYQRKVAFYGLSQEGVDYINRVAEEEAQNVLVKLNKELPKYVEKAKKRSCRVYYAGLCAFVFKERR